MLSYRSLSEVRAHAKPLPSRQPHFQPARDKDEKRRFPHAPPRRKGALAFGIRLILQRRRPRSTRPSRNSAGRWMAWQGHRQQHRPGGGIICRSPAAAGGSGRTDFGKEGKCKADPVTDMRVTVYGRDMMAVMGDRGQARGGSRLRGTALTHGIPWTSIPWTSESHTQPSPSKWDAVTLYLVGYY